MVIGPGEAQRHNVQPSEERQMADPQNKPEEGAAGSPSAPRKAPAGKAAAGGLPAKKVPAKVPARKTPAKKAAPKKAPAKKAPAKKAAKKPGPPPALEARPPQAALTAGEPPARPTATDAKSSTPRADTPAAPRSAPAGDYRLPLSLGLAAAGLVALVLSRFRRG